LNISKEKEQISFGFLLFLALAT